MCAEVDDESESESEFESESESTDDVVDKVGAREAGFGCARKDERMENDI